MLFRSSSKNQQGGGADERADYFHRVAPDLVLPSSPWLLPRAGRAEYRVALCRMRINLARHILACRLPREITGKLLLSKFSGAGGGASEGQARSPSSARAAGSSMPRTTVASMRTAAAIPTPRIFRSISDSVAKTEKTATMINAALVTTPALLAITYGTSAEEVLTKFPLYFSVWH